MLISCIALCAVTRVSQDAIKKRIIAYEALKKRADAPYEGDGFIKKATFRITRPASIGGYSDVDIASADVLKLSDSQTSSYKPGGWYVPAQGDPFRLPTGRIGN